MSYHQKHGYIKVKKYADRFSEYESLQLQPQHWGGGHQLSM